MTSQGPRAHDPVTGVDQKRAPTPAQSEHDGRVEDGERMLIACRGGPSASRLVRYPPPLEIEERGGVYVLVDDGPPEEWHYDFIPTQP